MVRADFEVCSTWEWTPEPPLNVPITVFGGCEDPFFDRELDPAGHRLTTIDDWSRQTASRFESHYRPGDHYFLVRDKEFLVQTIQRSFAWRQTRAFAS